MRWLPSRLLQQRAGTTAHANSNSVRSFNRLWCGTQFEPDPQQDADCKWEHASLRGQCIGDRFIDNARKQRVFIILAAISQFRDELVPQLGFVGIRTREFRDIYLAIVQRHSHHRPHNFIDVGIVTVAFVYDALARVVHEGQSVIDVFLSFGIRAG
jgi:hypothetical protein